MNDRDIRITPAISAYLAAFDYWLKHTWATGETGRQHDGATALKDVCFAEMTAAAGIPFWTAGWTRSPTLGAGDGVRRWAERRLCLALGYTAWAVVTFACWLVDW
jgi:hypothetical protein